MLLRAQINTLNNFIIRPWGSYIVLDSSKSRKVKRLFIDVGAKTSLQFHKHRCESLVIEQGVAHVVLGECELWLKKGDKFEVPASMIHRIANAGNVPLQILEVQIGEYLGEDDIVRLHDVYGRV